MKKLGIRQIILIISIGFVGVDSLFIGKGIPKILKLREKLDNVRLRIEDIDKENTALQALIEKLQSDPLAIETIAREELGMAQPGETIYQLPIERKKIK